MAQKEFFAADVFIRAVRSVGGVKPEFDPKINNFKPPQLTVRGTGFWIKGKNVFVTCAHVVENFLQRSLDEVGMLTVGGNGAAYRRATVNTIDYAHDLAVLNVIDSEESIKAQCAYGLDVSSEDPVVATPVAYAGYPFGNQLLDKEHSPTYAEGVVGKTIVNVVGPKTIQISGPSVGGYSGSPIVVRNSSQAVIGVLSNGPSDRGNTGNVFNAIHWRHVRDLVELTVG